jgi:hypothetical protein
MPKIDQSTVDKQRPQGPMNEQRPQPPAKKNRYPDYHKQYYLKNKERIIEQRRRYVDQNRDALRVYWRQKYYEKRDRKKALLEASDATQTLSVREN